MTGDTRNFLIPLEVICRHYIAGSLNDKILRGEQIEVYAEGKSCRDYTYIDDIIDGVMACRTAEYDYEIFNLGRSDTVVLSDLIGKIESGLNRKAKVRLKPTQLGDVAQTYADITKAKRQLGFSPAVSIDAGLRYFIDWYLQQRGNS